MSTIERAPATGLTTASPASGRGFHANRFGSLTMLPPIPMPASWSSWGSWSSWADLDAYGLQPERSVRIIVSQDDPIAPVAADLQDRLNVLLDMRSGWDAGRGSQLSADVVKAALPMIFGVLRGRLLAPQLFPLPDGGLQFEWHVNGRSIEVEVDADGSAFAIAEARGQGVVIEEDVDDATLLKLRQFLAETASA